MLSIYKASAGSGKTHTLTREYLLMLFRDYDSSKSHSKPHGHILAVTFTKKATAEMKERILQALYLLSTNPTESPFFKDLTEQLSLDTITLQIQSKDLLIGILQDYNHFSVSTIDGFFQQVVRTFAIELNLSTSYDLAMDGNEVIQQAVDDVFRRLRSHPHENKELMTWMTNIAQANIDDNTKWNPHQAVSLFSKELLKEELMRYMDEVRVFFADKTRIAQYRGKMQEIVKNYHAQIRTTQCAARDIIEGIVGLKEHAVSAFKVSPDKLIKDGLNKTFRDVLNDPNVLYTKSKTNKAQQEEILHVYATQLQPLYEQLQRLIDEDIYSYHTAQAILHHLYTVGLLQDINNEVETTNKKKGRIPISSVNMLIHAIIDGQEAPFIYERIGQYFRHFMIDEFQDTSALQWQNFEPLIRESESKDMDNLLVGDVKQSIYRWRNSDWRLLNDVHSYFHSAHLPKMKDNWRSAPLLIERNEWLIQGYAQWLSTIFDTKQWTDIALTKAIEQIYSYKAVHQEAQKKYPGVFHLEFFEEKTSSDINNRCLEAVNKLLQELKAEGIDFSRVTMLVRRKSEAEIVSNYLISNGYNVQSVEGMRIHAHATVKLLFAILQSHIEPQNEVVQQVIRENHAPFTSKEEKEIQESFNLPLYEQVQTLIRVLRLNEIKGAEAYLTAFQERIYQFTQDRVSDLTSFVEYWNRKKDSFSIPSSSVANTIGVMTIHGSKGLEFDIVILPFLNWELQKWHNEIIWCHPTLPPFDEMPLVAITASDRLLKSHFRSDYISEAVAQYIDNINLTYVAITRPKYRLYGFGGMYSLNQQKQPKIQNVGQLFSYICAQENKHEEKDIPKLIDMQDGSFVYHKADDIVALPIPDKEEKVTRESAYISTPIGNRLVLRSRAEDDFSEATPLETIDLGILMHEWLAAIYTWTDAAPAIQKMRDAGRITALQEIEMQKQLHKLQALLQQEDKNHWFDSSSKILTEQDILIPTGKVQRPDRLIINGNTVVVIDYKFGQEHPNIYQDQLRNYSLFLQQMGYQVEAYIIYVAQNKIDKIL